MLKTMIEPEKKAQQESSVILSAKDIKKHFPIKGGLLGRVQAHVKAVDGVSLDIYRGETLGLVGESGCGKSTIGRILLNLIEASSGSVEFEGQNIFNLSDEKMRNLRRDMQLIFQDPYSSLNPRLSVGDIIGRVLKIHGVNDSSAREKRVQELLELVGLSPHHIRRYPHEFSGGQRQRIGIARALALNPKFMVLDEAVSALDVSIQSQIVNLLEDLQEEFNLTYLFVSHGLNIVRHVSKRVGVMYLGKLVELAEVDELFENPKHPYTLALISANPIANPKLREQKNRIILEGDVPSPINPPSGCRFHTRCPMVQPICKEIEPVFQDHGNGKEHFAACHFTLN